MEVKVIQSKDMPSHLTGGEYAINDVTIYVDKKLPKIIKQNLVVHAVVECYCSSWSHPKVEELTDLIVDALEKLQATNKKDKG